MSVFPLWIVVSRLTLGSRGFDVVGLGHKPFVIGLSCFEINFLGSTNHKGPHTETHYIIPTWSKGKPRDQNSQRNKTTPREKMFEFEIESPIKNIAKKHLHRYLGRDHRCEIAYKIMKNVERDNPIQKLVKQLVKQLNAWMAALMCTNGVFITRTFFSIFSKENCSKCLTNKFFTCINFIIVLLYCIVYTLHSQSVRQLLNIWKPKKTSRTELTRNSFWKNFEKLQFVKFMIPSTEFLMNLFLFQMRLKSWLTVWSTVKWNKNHHLKWIFIMNWSNNWKKWRLV